ncbi:MAG: PASTA domain-containing protein [Gemmatimonadota bacterium]
MRLAGIVGGAAIVAFAAAYLFASFVLYPPAEAFGLSVEVPDLYDATAAEARELVRGAGLTVGETVEVADPAAKEGRVVAQSPLPGQALRPGGEVRLAISAGPARVRIPNLLGFEEGAAVAVLERAGFHVERSHEIDDEPAGRIARMQPAPGTERELPATVVLVVSSGPPGAVPEDTAAGDAGAAAGEEPR